jgi:hypothetical protein
MAYDDEDLPVEKRAHPPSVPRMSKTPSWVMLGFALGALFVYVLTRPTEPPPPAVRAPAPEPAKPDAPREPPPLSRIEALFDAWGRDATWEGDATEVAAWDPKEEAFADFYEVRRIEGKLYFRSIPKLTRRLLTYRPPAPGCPLQFTESEEDYQWRTRGRGETPPVQPNYRPTSNAAPVAAPPPPEAPKTEPVRVPVPAMDFKPRDTKPSGEP